jgi:hypothetical protein
MFASDIDDADREASVTVSFGMLFLLGLLVAMHMGGLRFASGVSAGVSL